MLRNSSENRHCRTSTQILYAKTPYFTRLSEERLAATP